MTGNRSTEQLIVRPRGRGIAVWAWVSTRDGVVRHGEGTVTGVAVVKERTGILVLSQPWNQKGKGGEVWSGRPGC